MGNTNRYAALGNGGRLEIIGVDTSNNQLVVAAGPAYLTAATDFGASSGLGHYEDRDRDGLVGPGHELLAVLKGVSGASFSAATNLLVDA